MGMILLRAGNQLLLFPFTKSLKVSWLVGFVFFFFFSFNGTVIKQSDLV